MKRRINLISTIFASCLALVMLGFGVYALTTPIVYDISGNISYTVTDTYVEVNTKIYKSDTYLTKGELADTVEQIANLSFADIESETNLTHITTLDDTYSSLEDFSGAGEYSKGDDLDFTFATSGDNTAFAYFIVMNIANLTQSEDVYAVMKDEIVDVENTFQYNNALQENILNGEDNRNMVIGIIVDDITTPIAENSPFSYGINIASGDVARSEQMTAKYTEDGEYYWSDEAKGVVVFDPSFDGIDTIMDDGGISYSENITAIYFREGLATIEENSLYGNLSLTKLVLPSSVSEIGGYQASQTQLQTIIVIECDDVNFTSRNEEVKELNCIIDIQDIEAKGLVQGCHNTKFDLLQEEDIATIGGGAFFGCTGLTSITIPDSVTSIGESVFFGCDSLTSIIVEEGNTKYTSRINGEETNSIIEIGEDGEGNDTYTLTLGCKNSVILDGVTSIGNSAFSNCTSLTSITIPDSVTSIGGSAFSGCTSLTSITIPDSVTSIEKRVFYSCTGLTSIIIPDSIIIIKDHAFVGCTSLTKIYMEHESDAGLTLSAGWDYDATVYYYSETEASGKWHYVDGVPVLW